VVARVLERSLDDITLPQYRVLTLIASSPERAGRVAERAALSRPSLTGILEGLVGRGWVQRSEVEGDRRGVHLEVTAAGAARLEAADRELAAALEEVLGELSNDERAQVLDGLAVLQAGLSARFEHKATNAPARAR
jgi:DNA-binding MarR family transcriptional regulator